MVDHNQMDNSKIISVDIVTIGIAPLTKISLWIINGQPVKNDIEISSNKIINPTKIRGWAINIQTWHNRLCHIGKSDLLKVRTLAEGVEISDSTLDFCPSCYKGKIRGINMAEKLPEKKPQNPSNYFIWTLRGLLKLPHMMVTE